MGWRDSARAARLSGLPALLGANRPARASFGPDTASFAARSSAAWTLRRSVFSAMGRIRLCQGETALQTIPNVPFINDGFVSGCPQRPQARAHHFGGVLIGPEGDQLGDEAVERVGEVDVAGGQVAGVRIQNESAMLPRSAKRVG